MLPNKERLAIKAPQGHPKGKLAVPMAPVPANRSNTDRYSSGAPHACICDNS